MASVVKLKRSNVAGKVPTTADLEVGEVAMNTADGLLYSRQQVDTTDRVVRLDRRENKPGDVALFGTNVDTGTVWIPANGNSFVPGIYPKLEPIFPGDAYADKIEVLLEFEGANGGSTFTDTSPRARTFTRNGTSTTTSTEQFKVGTSSGKFAGAGKNLASIYTPIDSTLDLASKDFTIEGWFYSASWGSSSDIRAVANWGQYSNGRFFWVTIANGYPVITSYNGTTYVFPGLSSSQALAPNQWNHVAWVRNGTSIKIFVNGIESASDTFSGSFTVDVARLTLGEIYAISSFAVTRTYVGYMDQVRITVGAARYTSNFDPLSPNSGIKVPNLTPPVTGTEYRIFTGE